MIYFGPKMLANFKKPRAPKRREPKARDRREGMSLAYLVAIRRLPSCVSLEAPCEAHHLRCAGWRGIGLKSTDKWALPLTIEEHRVIHTIGSRSEFGWFERRGVNCLDLAVALWAAFPDEDKMLSILLATRRDSGIWKPEVT